MRYSQLPVRCITGTAPSLFYLSEAYGFSDVVKWVMTFLVSLSEYSGLKNKITDHQLTHLAEVLVHRFRDMKATELMLFFSKVMAGEYGKVGYSCFDPYAITEMINLFQRYRAEIIAEEESRQQDLRYAEHLKHCVPMPEHMKHKLDDLVSSKTNKI